MKDSFFDHSGPEGEPQRPGGIPGLEEKTDSHSQDRPAEDRRMAAIMAYIPFLCFVPLIRMRDDDYVYFHARQGLILFFIEIVAFIFSFPHLSQLFWIAILIGCIGIAIAGALFAVQGKMHRLPIIGELAERIRM